MTDPERPNDDQLERHLAGESTPAERAAIDRWRRADPRNATLLDALRARGALRLGQRPWATDARWAALRSLLSESPAPARRVRGDALAGRTHAWSVGRIGRLAAAFVTTAVLAASAVYYRDHHVLEARFVTTGRAERRTLHTGDGSVITVGPSSTMRYSAQRSGRSVELHGLARFVVVHDAAQPFRVHAGITETTDVGTDFVVRAYDADRTVGVAVTTGEVEVATLDREAPGRPGKATLRAGDGVHVGRDGALTIDKGGAASLTYWLDGRLVLDNVSMAEAGLEISRWFDVDVRIADSALARRRVTAIYTTPTLDGVLGALGASVGARVERNGASIVLRSVR
ncbi:MAG: FecR domain-containing protein [bacterium]